MIVCVHLPRFELVAAAGGPEALTGRALAIAPSGSGPARIGEVLIAQARTQDVGQQIDRFGQILRQNRRVEDGVLFTC